MTRIRKQPLSKQHDRAGFDCGVAELNTFIQKTARRQDERHLVRTTVLVDTDQPDWRSTLAKQGTSNHVGYSGAANAILASATISNLIGVSSTITKKRTPY